MQALDPTAIEVNYVTGFGFADWRALALTFFIFTHGWPLCNESTENPDQRLSSQK
jgi:hypothetical protein